MISKERIEKAAGDYRDELLKEKNRTTGQFVGMPLTHKQIESQAEGYAVGMEAGVRFAEAEMKSVAMEFAEWCADNATGYLETGNDDLPRLKDGEWYIVTVNRYCKTGYEKYTTSELYAKFEAERSAK